MPRPSIPAALLDARGVPISLLDETKVTLYYSMRSIAQLEKLYDRGLSEALLATATQEVTATARLIAAGLLHEHGGDGAPYSEDYLLDLLDTTQLKQYGDQATDALVLAFPHLKPADEDEAEDGEASPPVEGSPGQSGGGGASDTSTSAPPSGGP